MLRCHYNSVVYMCQPPKYPQNLDFPPTCRVSMPFSHIKQHCSHKKTRKNRAVFTTTLCNIFVLFRIFILFYCNSFDFKQYIFWKSCNFYTASSWVVCSKVFLIHAIDCTKFIHFFDEYCCFNYVI